MVRIVLHQGDAGVDAREDLAGKLRRNVEHAVDFSDPQIVDGEGAVVIIDGGEGFGVGGDGLEHFVQFDGGNAVVLIHDADLEVFDFSTEGVAEHDQLHERHDHGNEHKRRAAPEAAEVAFNDGPDAVHKINVA